MVLLFECSASSHSLCGPEREGNGVCSELAWRLYVLHAQHLASGCHNAKSTPRSRMHICIYDVVILLRRGCGPQSCRVSMDHTTSELQGCHRQFKRDIQAVPEALQLESCCCCCC